MYINAFVMHIIFTFLSFFPFSHLPTVFSFAVKIYYNHFTTLYFSNNVDFNIAVRTSFANTHDPQRGILEYNLFFHKNTQSNI